MAHIKMCNPYGKSEMMDSSIVIVSPEAPAIFMYSVMPNIAQSSSLSYLMAKASMVALEIMMPMLEQHLAAAAVNSIPIATALLID